MSFFKAFTNYFKVKDVGGFESLQKRVTEKKEYLEKLLSCFNSLDNSLKNFSQNVLNSQNNLNNLTLCSEEKFIHDTAKSIYQKVLKNTEENSSLITKIMSNISGHLSKLNKEISFYDELKKANKELQEEKEKLKKNKESYHKLGKEAENQIKRFAKNIPNVNAIFEMEDNTLVIELEDMGDPAQKALYNYKLSIKKTNELIRKYNEKQTTLYNYLPELGGEDGVFFFRLIKLYLQSLENSNKHININMEQIKNSKNLETKSELKELIDIAENNKREEKYISIIHYQTDLDMNKCQDDKEFELFSRSIVLIKNFISDEIFPNYNYDIDLKVYKIHQLLKKLFKEKGEIDPKLSEDFLNSLNDPTVHKGFYILLSQLRTNNQFLKTKYIIELLGKAFHILLENAGKNKLFDNIKNSIILSQTYYYENDNKNKVYIFEYIKNNRYLKNSQFWRSFIEDMIKKEFTRIENILPDSNFNVEKNINITKKIKEKLNEVVFSQLITYSSNMKDFEIDIRVILKIMDEFIKKYNYLSDNNINVIYGVISPEIEEIEKLRKEYNTSLEDELIIEKDVNEEEKSKEEDKKNNSNIENKDKEISTKGNNNEENKNEINEKTINKEENNENLIKDKEKETNEINEEKKEEKKEDKKEDNKEEKTEEGK